MSTDIRASVSLAARNAQAARQDSASQNQILDIGSEAAFPQILERQTNLRTEPRADARDDSSRPARQEEAAARQSSGKRLPERAERNDDRNRADQARQRKDAQDSRDANDFQRAEAAKADARVDKNKDKSEAARASEDDSKSDSASADPTAAVQAQAVPVEQVPAPIPGVPVATQVVVIEGEVVASAETALAAVAAEAAVSVTSTDPSSLSGATSSTDTTGEISPAAAELLAAASETADSTLIDPTLVTDETAVDADGLPAAVAEAMALVEGEGTAPVTDPAASAETVVRTGDAAQALAAKATAQAEPAVASETARNSTTAENARMAQGVPTAATGTTSDEALTSSALDAAPDLAASDKSAEARAENDKVPRATPERVAAFREQLAVLAQQVEGGNRATAAASSKKSDTIQDVKGFALTRNLESLSAARADAGKPVSTGIQTPLTSREWAGEVGQRLLMMVSSKIKSAEIHLNPKELGPMEVRVRMHEDKAHVVFTSQVPQTREALEQAVPRLREMLDQNGVTLGNVNVQDHGAQHSHQRQQQDQHVAGGSGGGQAAEEAEAAVPVARREISLVDFYA
ncbi:MAG TPA: flagellar hook-length control protein FliK [Dongiaceae bacterium]|nr:flagellar hook-length control protein FliK [Dongiaceae bacterium]